MASQFDDTDFIDREYQQSQQSTLTGESDLVPAPAPAGAPVPAPAAAQPPVSAPAASHTPSPSMAGPRTAPLPTREELEAKVGDTQVRLSQLKRQQEELENQRAALEETRRRRKEFHDGKAELQQQLTRGITLLEEAELALRRDSMQMTKALEGFRESLDKISGSSEEEWTPDNVEVELTRALTAIENGRMEWNAARLKWDFLDGEGGRPTQDRAESSQNEAAIPSLASMPFPQLCRMGLALTWPVVVVGAVLALILLTR